MRHRRRAPSYLLAASPASANFNAKRLWFSFAFSEPILLLYDPLHSFTENLQTSTAERLLSMICSPGQVGECISVAGGTVLSAAVRPTASRWRWLPRRRAACPF